MAGTTASRRIEAEYSALPRSERIDAVRDIEFGDGAFAFHGDKASDDDWSLTFVRERDRAVLPLCAGTWESAEAECLRRQEVGLPLDGHPFPAVIFQGGRRCFRAVRGRHLVGVVEVDDVVVLLGAAGSSFLLIVRRGTSRHVIPTGPTHGLTELNLDALLPELDLGANPRTRRRRTEVTRPEPLEDVEGHHDRILHGLVPAPTSDRVSVPLVVQQGFRRLADRASASQRRRVRAAHGRRAHGRPDPRRAVRRDRGARFVYRLVEILQHLGGVGCGDLVGRLGDLHARILEILPDEKFSAQALSDGLHRLAACGTCLVRKPSPRTWHVRLAGLTDWRTPLHRQFCAETPTAYRFGPEPHLTRGAPEESVSPAPAAGRGPERPAASTPTHEFTKAGTPTEKPSLTEPRASSTPQDLPAPVVEAPKLDLPFPELIVLPAETHTNSLHEIYASAAARLQEQLAARVSPEPTTTPQIEDSADDPNVAPTIGLDDADPLPSAAIMTIVAALVAEGLAQTQAELAAVREEAAREAAEHARERDLLLQKQRSLESETMLIVQRAETMVARMMSIVVPLAEAGQSDRSPEGP